MVGQTDVNNAQSDAPAHRVRKPKKSPGPVPFNLSHVLAEAAWSEADHALARALADLEALEAAVHVAAKRLKRAKAEAQARAVEDSLLVLRQSLMQAARKRGLAALGDVGAIEPYDPSRHELVKASSKPPVWVKVLARGWRRGLGPEATILVRSRAAPTRIREARA
ncbi:MAG: hypothetical protein ABUL42_03405 [Terricaulis silvestris]